MVFELLDSLILLLGVLGPCLGHLLQLAFKAIDELFVLRISLQDGLLESRKLLLLHFILLSHLLVECGKAMVCLICCGQSVVKLLDLIRLPSHKSL